jgi:hypothetical protein
MIKLLAVSHGLLPHRYSSQTRESGWWVQCWPYNVWLEDDDSDIDFSMFDSEHNKSSDPDDCCHHIEKVSTSIQMFSIFITN